MFPTFLSVKTLSCLGLSSHCSVTSNLAASGLNFSQRHIYWSHKAIIAGLCTPCTHLILSATLQFVDFWCIVSCWGRSIFAYSVLEFSSSSCKSDSFSGSYPTCFVVYVWLVVYYEFAFCGICLFLLPRDIGIGIRLSCAFWLWPCCQASPHGPSNLGSGQTMVSPTGMCCYFHCYDNFSGWELQCRLIVIESSTSSNTGQLLMFIQHNNSVSIAGLLAVLNERPLVWYFSFQTLQTFEQSIPCLWVW